MQCRNILSTAAQTALPSGVRRMFELAKKYNDSINLTLGEPGFTAPDHIIEAGIKGLRDKKTKYTPNAGIKELRDAIAWKLEKENGIKCDPDKNLIVTAGATQALMLAMVTLVNPGDEVIIQGPNWPDYRGQIDMVNAKTVYAKADEKNDFKMTADVIEPLITDKTKLIIINSPSNPTGGVLDYEDLKAIAELVKKYKIFVISDEPYEKLVYDGFHQHSLPGDWSDDIDPITASVAVFPDTEELKNVKSATLTDIDEGSAYSFDKLGAYLPTHIKEGYHFAKASLYETTMKDGTKYYQLRVTFADGDITEADSTTNPETGEQSKDAPLTTANTYMVFIMNYQPGEEYTIYYGDALTEYIRELPSNGVFHFSLDDMYVGFVPYDLTSEDVQAVVNSMK